MNRSKNKTQRKSGPKATKGKGGNLVPTESNQSGAKPFEPSQSKPTLRGNKNDKFKDVHAKVDSGRHSDPKQAATKKVEISEPPPKLERANSFSLTRKLSQIYNKLSGSRECLATPSEGAAQPYQFTRSLSLSSIQLKKNYRKSLNESNLSRVHEDAILEHTESNEETENHSPPTPIEPPKLERSNSILASFRRKLSFRSDKKPKLPAKWNTSLQNLRQEDFMVSYDDLSFVDYDQFNQYEAHLERKLSISQRDLSLTQPSITQRPPATEHPIVEAANPPVIRRRQKTDHDLRRKMLVRKSFDLDCNFDLDKNLYRNSIDDEKLKFLSKVNRKSFRWSADVERDVDALNLDSLDQLPVSGVKRASEEAAQSISAEKVIDVCDSGMIDEEESLKCENLKNKRYSVSVGYVSRSESLKRSRSWNDAVEYLLESKKPSEQLKSRSLTHLDKLEPHIAPQSSIPIDYHQLERCKVSSSEYFSVYFDTSDTNGFQDEILIPATKGVCLADSLHSSLSQRSLSFSQICVLDNGFINSQELGIQYVGPLDAYTDISSLAGRTLLVADKESTPRQPGGHAGLQKAASVGYRSTSSRLFTSTSTDETYDQSPKASSASSSKQSKQKWTISFGSKGPQKSKLCELLDSYNKGIPKLTSSASNFDKPEFLEALDGLKNLPQSWTDVVNHAGMGETETKIQSAIWELVTTEVYYILALQTVTDLFLACLEDIQSHSILTDVDQNKLFSNIRDICESNLKFWTYFLYPMVKESAETKQPMSVCKFKDGFIKFSVIFHPYTKYCAEQSTCQYYCKELYQNNSLFMSYCAWCESQKMCNRLRLADILVRPMQRLTKYGLLLVAIKKHIVGEHESETIDEMIHSVEEFVAGVNTHLTNRQENERLKGINARIDSYEVVDSNNENLDKMVKHYSTMFDLCLPMLGTTEGRKLFLEGDLKYKDCLGKMDVHCFLLTDFLLVCKKNKHENLKIVRQPYMTDRLTVQIKEQTLYCCYLNELSLVVAAFTLHCSKAQSWYDSITKAKHIYSRLKLGTASDMRQYGTNISICSINNINSNMNINNDNLSIRKSPLNSSIGSRVSSLNNSHSGSVDLNESKPVSIDFEKANSLSSDDGANGTASAVQGKFPPGGQWKPKSTVTTMLTSSNSLTVQPFSALGQSMPNLNLSSIPNNNTLSVPGTSGSHSHSGMVLLSPSQRGISYPPPSPTRATLRRGFAFSSSIKNPPLIKTRNVASQQSFILSQQPSFNSATLGQHQQCLQTPSPGSSPNVPFIKRKNSFQSQSPSGSNQVQGQSAVFDPNSHETDAT
ncbi:pleckstrin homology domain-containing family G member 5 isoform X1 [Sabethes cyaneus]|uniref:pleckstrin homology domain-containing family G member 5 isoform X1 n=1 Tax=Sabethes cyaneus TaxID=53552 RepID=UPI00237E3ACF|nr:pleckstrin homology domain-containing family G member 5 isoform X1 [Sabethes cyaneus]